MNFTLTLAVFFTHSWICVAISEFFIVEVHPGEEVTLTCSNFSSVPHFIHWFKLDKGTHFSQISTMSNSEDPATLHEGFQNGRFTMTSNTKNLFLKIKDMDFSDSGLYCCGFNKDENPVPFSATYLQVKHLSGLTNLLSFILGGVIIILVVIIICLVVKICSLKTTPDEEQNPHHNKNLDDNYARLSFRPRARRSQNLPPEREMEPNVVYAATR
ncbi:sodium channel subunit beta-4-like [Cololabis saira]|uniref:sodium channel subunit beta-4-like n=1 Tax=Cololabis saira TaxID=129043 RepID=UPI002AD3C5AF|nr:sodium channel subunit beta-4-like [Cololabis saira]